MSTRVSLAYNFPDAPTKGPHCDPDCPAFHLYAEVFETDGGVYLQMPCEFEATNQGVTLRIPAEVWNRLVAVGPRSPDPSRRRQSHPPETEKGGPS